MPRTFSKSIIQETYSGLWSLYDLFILCTRLLAIANYYQDFWWLLIKWRCKKVKDSNVFWSVGSNSPLLLQNTNGVQIITELKEALVLEHLAPVQNVASSSPTKDGSLSHGQKLSLPKILVSKCFVELWDFSKGDYEPEALNFLLQPKLLKQLITSVTIYY